MLNVLKMTPRLVLLVALLFATKGFAADSNLVMRGMDDVYEARQQTQYLMRSSLSSQDLERVRYIDQKLLNAYSILNRSLDDHSYPNPGPYPPPHQNFVEFFHSDNCSSELIGGADYTTNCAQRFANASSSWAVKINGQCFNIADTSTVKACEVFKDVNPNGVRLLHSDTCSASSELVAIVDSRTNCQTLRSSAAVWGIEVNGQCQNISDMPAVDACERFKDYIR